MTVEDATSGTPPAAGEPPEAAPPPPPTPTPPTAPPTPPTPPTAPAAEQPNTRLLEVKDRVWRYLADLVGAVQLTPDGMFSFPAESTQVFIRCLAWGTDSTLVGIDCPVLLDCPASPELYEHVATHNSYHFGHLAIVPGEDGKVLVLFTHTLLGDYLDPEELKVAVVGVAGTAKDLDDELKAKFGGRRFHEDAA